jgi:tetratricopeptide (TPR) repeat protein
VDYEEIEKYLHNGLTENERQSFEQALAANPALATEVELYRQTEMQLAAAANAAKGEAQLTQQLTILNKQYFTGKAAAPVVNIKKSKRLYYYIGSAAAAVLAILLIQPLITSQKTGEELYAANIEKVYESFSTSRGVNDAPDNTSGNALYNNKAYKAALAVFEPIATNNADTLLAKAVCYLETGNSDKALEIYNGMIGSRNQTDRVNLHKAMLYLKKGDKAASRSTLELIAKEYDDYAIVSKLLNEL